MPLNTTAFLEKSKTLIYPSADFGIQSTIPLWMKFYCYEYSSTALGRVIASNRGNGGSDVSVGIPDAVAGGALSLVPIPAIGSKEKAQIFLPAPVNFQTNTSHKYEPAPTKATSLLPNYFTEFFRAKFANLFPALQQFGLAFDNLAGTLNDFFGSEQELLANISDENRYKDSTFMEIGPSRTFEIKFNLPCLTVQDSMKAGQIIRAFEALSLPTALGFLNASTTKAYHPPVWIFGIGPIDQRKFDTDWTGMPQLSVLKAVSHKKTAFETNSLAGLGGLSILKPVCYTLSLSFIELEPAFRATAPGQEASLNIINRSTVLATTGVSITGRP